MADFENDYDTVNSSRGYMYLVGDKIQVMYVARINRVVISLL